jgi:hypothetical protein
VSEPIDYTKASEVANLLSCAAASMRSTSSRVGCTVHLPDTGTLLIAGDLHDHLPNFMRIIGAADLSDPSKHLVLQELIHGPTLVHNCDMSWRMLTRVSKLLLEYPGRVHPLLGNHENSQLTGVGVTKGGGNSVEQFEDGLAMSFGEEWESVAASVDDFLQSMPLAVRTASGVQCTHSLPNAALTKRFDPSLLDREMSEDDRRGPTGSAYLLTWGRQFTDDQVDELRTAWGVRCFVIGHVQIEAGVRRMGEHVMALASDQESGAVLQVDLAQEPSVDAMFAAAQPIQLLPAWEPTR